MTPYMMYRGKCKELSEAAVAADPSLTLVRGWYYDAVWNKQEQHWWTKRADGTIFDPSKAQFPTNGYGEYTEYDEFWHCDECGARRHESEVRFHSNYVLCSSECLFKFVGISECINQTAASDDSDFDWDEDGPF